MQALIDNLVYLWRVYPQIYIVPTLLGCLGGYLMGLGYKLTMVKRRKKNEDK